jgi:hypothetical protein
MLELARWCSRCCVIRVSVKNQIHGVRFLEPFPLSLSSQLSASREVVRELAGGNVVDSRPRLLNWNLQWTPPKSPRPAHRFTLAKSPRWLHQSRKLPL